MSQSKIPKRQLQSLAIIDTDVNEISPSKISTTDATNLQVVANDNGTASWVTIVQMAQFIDEEIPTGTMNGSNVTFTLENTPDPASSLQLFLGGVLLSRGQQGDYTLSGDEITMAHPPGVNDYMIAYYRY